MKLSEFDFDLPSSLIAQYPVAKRENSNLLIPSESGNKIVKFYNIVDYLQDGDLLIFNDSKVINAKLTLDTETSKINVNLNKPSGKNSWFGFAKPAKKLKEGDEFTFGNHKISIKNKLDAGEIEIEFHTDNISVFEFLRQYGEVPLPQYIKRSQDNDKSKEEDFTRYQNVYSKIEGSVAAATAGLHFSQELINKIQNKNIDIDFVTLHVGAGTFLPVKTDNIYEHKMHSEWCEILPSVAEKINLAKKLGKRVVVVGTTAMRVIESFARNNVVYSGIMETDIFITPKYKFQIADALITNFHLPKSTLFMLVCAFSGYEKMQALYKYAIDKKMRFFSYGDAMILSRAVDS